MPRPIMTFAWLVKRLCKRLTNWINWPTSRERMWWMYTIGKAQGRREALAELPIVKVQPRQETEPLSLHLPPGMWTRHWRKAHLTKYGVMPVDLAKVPTAHDLTGDLDETTKESPAVVALLHQGRQAERARNAG